MLRHRGRFGKSAWSGTWAQTIDPNWLLGKR
jgi:hypothetical protein